MRWVYSVLILTRPPCFPSGLNSIPFLYRVVQGKWATSYFQLFSAQSQPFSLFFFTKRFAVKFSTRKYMNVQFQIPICYIKQKNIGNSNMSNFLEKQKYFLVHSLVICGIRKINQPFCSASKALSFSCNRKYFASQYTVQGKDFFLQILQKSRFWMSCFEAFRKIRIRTLKDNHLSFFCSISKRN